MAGGCGSTYEPDFLITYRGCAGVIEVGGPHHAERVSNGRSRERLLWNAGVKHIDRLDVRDIGSREEGGKVVTNVLKRLVA